MNTEFRARLNLFQRPACTAREISGQQKAPRPGGVRGEGVRRRAGYFFVTKMYFAYCDLWCEAALRWMTWLLTALSRAEQ